MSKFFAAFFSRGGKPSFRLRKILKISAFTAVLAIIAPALLWAAGCGDKNKGKYTYSLARSSINLDFESPESRYSLPAVNSDDPGEWSYEWSYKESSISDAAAYLIDQRQYSLNPIDPIHMTETASAVFTATVTHAKGETELYFTVNVTDKASDVFDDLYSSQRGNTDYQAQGIGRSRVFGLYDYSGPSSVTHLNYTQAAFVKSYDEFQLRWNYNKSVYIDVWTEDAAGNRSTEAGEAVYKPETDPRTVRVNFKKEGSVRVVAESRIPYRDDLKARWEYTYEIVDAVNTRDFADIKLMEKLARYDYIVNGVPGVGRKAALLAASPSADLNKKAALSDYIEPGSDPDGLLSRHFKTAATPYPAAQKDKGGHDERYETPGYYYNEFERWAPAYKYKDIVVRSASKTQAVRRMYTWAEGTWFFGSVYGNGYELNATTYTRGGIAGHTDGNYAYQGRYRNSHTVRGRDPDSGGPLSGTALGVDGKPFFAGYGWGEVFAFYAVSNNSVIDNLTLTGEDIPQGAAAVKLYQYHKMGVLGTSQLAGKDLVFSQGQAHDNGAPIKGLYHEGVRVQNSYLEKGLTLFGASFSPDVNNPAAADTCVFRYGGFTGILGSAYGGGIGGEDMENGKQIALNNHLAIRDEAEREAFKNGGKTLAGLNTAVLNPQNEMHGNFVRARNNIFHDISVSPYLTMPSQSGTHIDVTGNENYYYTWLKSNEIQFPDMKHPQNEGIAIITVMGVDGTLNANIPTVMDYMFDKARKPDNRVARYEQSNGVFLINVPAISVADAGAYSAMRNTVSFENSSVSSAVISDSAHVKDAIPAAPDSLNQGFYLMMLKSPDNAPAEANLIRAEDNNSAHIGMRIANMTPAGTKTPTVVARTFADLSAQSVKLLSGTKGVVSAGKPVTMSGHKIQYKGQNIPAAYNPAEDSFTVTMAALKGAGIDKFGFYKLDLAAEAGGAKVSSFAVLLQGSDGTNPSVTPGSTGFETGGDTSRFIKYGLNLEDGAVVGKLTLFPQNTPLDYTFENGILRFDGSRLKDGANLIAVGAGDYTLNIRQEVRNKAVGADSYAVDLQNNPDYRITLWRGAALNGLSVKIDGVVLGGSDYTVRDGGYTLMIANGRVREILGARYYTPGAYEVIITNSNGMNFKTLLTVTGDGGNASIVSVTPAINKAGTHKDYRDVIVELSGCQGQNVLGVAFTADGVPAFTDPSVIKYDERLGFKTEKKADGNYLLTIPAQVIAESAVAAGKEYRLTVFTGVSEIGVLSAAGRTVYVYDANHDEAAAFARENAAAGLDGGKGLTLEFAKDLYIFDKGLFGSDNYGGSSFPADGVVLRIYKNGAVVAELTAADLIRNAENGTGISFILSDGAGKTQMAIDDIMDMAVGAITASLGIDLERILGITIGDLISLTDINIQGAGAPAVTVKDILKIKIGAILELTGIDMESIINLTGLDIASDLGISREELMDMSLEELLVELLGSSLEELLGEDLAGLLDTDLAELLGMDPADLTERTIGGIIGELLGIDTEGLAYKKISDLLNETGMELDDLLSLIGMSADNLQNIPRTGRYASGIYIPLDVLQAMGAGEYTVEVVNNYNVTQAVVTVA